MKEESQLGLNAQHVWGFYVDKEEITMQGWPQILKPEVAELSKRRIEMAHRYGQKIIAYGPWYLCRKATDYPVFGREMWAEPFRDMSCFGTGHCWRSPFADLFVWLQVQRVRDLGIDGFRSDGSTDPLICSSLEHTSYGSQCGWLDDNGKLQGSFGIFSTREALKRLWRIFHGGERTDGICAHGSGLGYDALYNHIDITIDSEGSETFTTKALKDKPLDYWRASKLWRPHGLQSIYGGKLIHLGMDSRHAIAVIHDLLPRSSPSISSRIQALDYAYSRQGEGIVQVVWALRQWIGAKDLRTRFYGYWENQGWVNTGSEDLPVGVYLMEGRKAALVIGNMSRKSEMAAVTLKKAKFHFGDNPWYALDPATGVRYEVKDNGDSVKLTIPVGAESFRMVMLSPTPLKADVPAVKGKSLIDIADFAGAD
ncbi:MAG: hypothetical protein WCP55_19450, partial [Lentisphaerota bacterium]